MSLLVVRDTIRLLIRFPNEIRGGLVIPSDIVLIAREVLSKLTPSGLIRIDSMRETRCRGVVRFAGDAAASILGENVVFSEFGGSDFEVDGVTYWRTSLDFIYGIVEGDHFALDDDIGERVLVKITQRGNRSRPIVIPDRVAKRLQDQKAYFILDTAEVILSTHPDYDAGDVIFVQAGEGASMTSTDFDWIKRGEEFRVYREELNEVAPLKLGIAS